jgi:hypothetical protein
MNFNNEEKQPKNCLEADVNFNNEEKQPKNCLEADGSELLGEMDSYQ